MSHCLVEWMNGVYDRDGLLPVHRSWIIRDNKWRAARYGVEADIIVDDDGRLVPLRDAIADLVHQLGPVADRLGCAAELDDALVMAERPSYVRQREAAAASGGSLTAVVDSLVRELRTDRPWAPGPGPGG